MIVLKMTTEEAGVLKGVLGEALDEVKEEIVRTENWERKDNLKKSRRLMEQLAAGLEKSLTARPAGPR